jgi:peroxiredoxin Q/BCP
MRQVTASTRLEPGDLAPEFVLADQSGAPFARSDLLGSRSIIYFYPEADTPGCTTQACDFEENMGVFERAGYRVVGISRDDVPKIAAFAEKRGLHFPLLSDPDHQVHDAYGAYGEKLLYGKTVVSAIRSTFVLDEECRIVHALYNVKATGHVAMLRKRLKLMDAAAG